MTESTDIWQEGADERECGDCGHTSHSCTCYEVVCENCTKFTNHENSKIWNGKHFCDEECLDLYINE